jgi:hypothetical protein
MANLYTTGYQDPATARQQVRDHKGARLRLSSSYVLPASAPAANDIVWLLKLPSNAKLSDLGTIKYGAFGGAAAAHLGFYHAKMTGAEATAANKVLWNAQSIVAAGTRALTAGVSNANLEKRLWQLAGLTADPGGEIDLILTISTVAAAAAALQADAVFVTD